MIGHGFADRRKTHALFLPDLRYDSVFGAKSWSANEPLRLLFMGRILRYKGLSLLLDAIEMLRADGLQVRLGLPEQETSTSSASGSPHSARRSSTVGLRIRKSRHYWRATTRWRCPISRRVESGVAAVAFGSCMPVIAMPSGGLAEQVIEGKTGVLAQNVSARSFADGIRRLVTDLSLYAQISRSLEQGGRIVRCGRSSSTCCDGTAKLICERR